MYKVKNPFTEPLRLLKPSFVKSKGSVKKAYPEKGELFYGSFKTFGGTEKVLNDVLVVENTAVIETWYRPDITADCMIEDRYGVRYEILGTPENIDRRNQYLKFKVRAIKGGA